MSSKEDKNCSDEFMGEHYRSIMEGHYRSVMEIVHTYKMIISSDADALAAKNPDATVEAEYGNRVVPGKLRTMAHHTGPYRGEPCPCCVLNCQELLPAGSTVGLSHIDLDALGGVLRLARYREPEGAALERAFWLVAESVDTEGVHFLDQILNCWSPEMRTDLENRLNAWYAWSEKYRYFAPKDCSVADCTSYIQEALTAIYFILRGSMDYIVEGRKWRNNKASINHESMKKRIITPSGKLFVRQHKQFTNSYYEWGSDIADLVLAHNLESGAITLSRRDRKVPTNCCKIMQSCFGGKAGGHAGIAGSPRGVKYSSEEFGEYILQIVKLLETPNNE